MDVSFDEGAIVEETGEIDFISRNREVRRASQTDNLGPSDLEPLDDSLARGLP